MYGMELLNRFSGRIHFLFADEDFHYLDSLVRLPFRPYLFHCMKRYGRGPIFFIQESGPGVQVSTLEETAAVNWGKGRKDERLAFHFPRDNKKAVQEKGVYRISYKAAKQWREAFFKMLEKEEGQSVFVFPLNAFVRLFSEGAALQRLTGILERVREPGIILLTASQRAEESLPYLLDAQGIFGSSLFPEIAVLQKVNGGRHFYKEMERALGNRFHLQTPFALADFQNMLLYGWLIEEKEWDWNPGKLKEYAEILNVWYHFPETSGIMNDGGCFTMKRLYESLADGRVWEGMNHQLEQPIPGKREKESYPMIGLNGENKKMLDGLKRAISDMPSAQKSLCQERVERLRQALTVPCAGHTAQALKVPIGQTIQWLNQREMDAEFCGTQEGEAVEKILSYLEYCVFSSEFYTDQKLFMDKAEKYKKTVEIHMKIEKLTENVENLEKQFLRCGQQFQDQWEIVRKMEEKKPRIQEELGSFARGAKELSADALLLNAEKEKLVKLDQEKNAVARIIAGKKHERNMLRENASRYEILTTALMPKKQGGEC